ncbi:hypothetical protein D770_07340 [Flammeovirgaceae bacterium 311]|nr:hypothetical protein D770_07340 [Flammeovirgaceae bacterium 311]
MLLQLGGIACSTAKIPEGAVKPQSYLAGVAGGLLYNATFQYKEFNASGLLVLKRLQPSEYHVVLLSKFGVSLMEFRLNDEGIHWVKTFKQLNNSKVEKMLERDFRVLMLSALDNPRRVKLQKQEGNVLTYKVKGSSNLQIKTNSDNGRVMYAENRGFLNPVKTKVQFLYNEEGDIPQGIALKHRNIDLGLELNLLKVIDAER